MRRAGASAETARGMNRRSFLLGLFAAPAIIAVDRLMPIRPFLPIVYADGIRDDHAGLTALLMGEEVDIRAPRLFHHHPTHTGLGFTSVNNTFALSKPLVIPKGDGWRRDSFIGASFMKHPR